MTGPNGRTAEGLVLIAPDKFKGSAGAVQVAEALAAGVRRAAPGQPVVLLPVADGGEGTVEAAVTAGFERRTAVVAGPLGDPVRAHWALREDVAVVEMAQASGLNRLPGGCPAPLDAGTRGTGELLSAALDAGARTLVLGAGGSASTDGGAGMLAALGVRFLDAHGRELRGGGGALSRLAAVDTDGLDPRLSAVRLVLASDVDNPLLGPEGAAAVYGPQKGANEQQTAVLETALGRLVDALAGRLGPRARQIADSPGAGAAGGLGYAALLLGAERRPGIDVLLDVLGAEQLVRRARLVVTGEGSLDAQSLRGKAPVGVARLARRHGVPVVAVCGRTELPPQQLAEAGFRTAFALTDLEPDTSRCMADAAGLLERTGERIARELLHG